MTFCRFSFAQLLSVLYYIFEFRVCRMHLHVNIRRYYYNSRILLQDSEVLKKVLKHENSLGYARAEEWSPGLAQAAHFSFLDPSFSNSTESITENLSEGMVDLGKISVGNDGTMHPPRSLNRGNRRFQCFDW